MKFGSHISFNGTHDYLIGAAKETIKNKANSMMIYLGGPQSTIRVSPDKYGIIEFSEKYSSLIPFENIVVHAPYIVNPSSKSKGKFAVEFLIQEINRMNQLGAKYLVLHPGSATDSTKSEAMNLLIDNLKEIIASTNNVVILIETMSGKGNEMCSTLDELSILMQSINSDRIGVCLDTCHIWDAGYDLNNDEDLIKNIANNGLLEKIKVIHVNDSKNPLGSNKDRHENIGKGFIGENAIKKFISNSVFNDVIKILETPYVDDKPIYDKEIEMLFLK